MIGNSTVFILRPTADGVDRYRNVAAGTPTRIEVCGASIAPRSSVDLRDGGRNGAIIGLTVYMPAGTDVQASDGVEVDGVAYEIDGVPGVWKSPFSGRVAGVEVPLVRTAG